jgi:hypothetical protein
MNWFGFGHGATAWELSFRELEHFVRRVRGKHRSEDPEQELPGVEISDRERIAALHREVARRRDGAWP